MEKSARCHLAEYELVQLGICAHIYKLHSLASCLDTSGRRIKPLPHMRMSA